jgi:shikimate dehydrogenase
MHNASFAADGLDFVYVALDVRPEDLPAAVKGATVLGLRGFNATMPHKRALPPLLDEVDAAAGISGAVNTVAIEPDGRLLGYDTDGGGLVEACKEAGIALPRRRVLLLGAGGAAASIAVALNEGGISQLRIVNRNTRHAEELADKLRAMEGGEVNVYGPDALNEAARDAQIIVNATPLGMKDGDQLPIPAEYLNEDRAICDAVYRPGAETDLVRHARERGARVVAGERMLLFQGVLAQRLWTGREPNVAAMSNALSLNT